MRLLVLIFFGLYQLLCLVDSAVINSDRTYFNFRKIFAGDSYVRIPYYIDVAAYNAIGDRACPAFIEEAVLAMNRDLLNCIQFGPKMNVPSQVPADFLFFSPVANTGASPATCIAPQGRVNQDVPGSSYKYGQKVIIKGPSAGGADCCDSARSVMRMLAQVLGLREEHRRPNAITAVSAAQILPTLQSSMAGLYTPFTQAANPYRVFKRTAADPFSLTVPADADVPVDFKSITMVAQNKYSATGANVWTPVNVAAAELPVPTDARLSLRDCQAIATKYGCLADGAVCANPYGQLTTGL